MMIALQAASSQPLALGAHDSPSIDTTLLATLIIPCLEIYLATHTNVRFLLLEYPAEHLPTALALQDLIGHDIFKVSGIVKGEDPEPVMSPGQENANGGPSVSKRRAARRARRKRSSSASQQAALFSQADFVLTSSATDTEVATFVSMIWKVLITVSEFYAPDHKTRKVASRPTLESHHASTSSSTSPRTSAHVSPTRKASFRPSHLPAIASSETSPNLPPTPCPALTQRDQPSPPPAGMLNPPISPRRGGVSRHGDSRHGDSRHGDSRHDDFRHGDPRHGDPRHGDSRHHGDPRRMMTPSPIPAPIPVLRHQQRAPSPTPSIGDTIRSVRTARSARPRLRSLRPATAARKGEVGRMRSGAYEEYDDDDDDEEEEYDLDERRLVPRFLLARANKGNSRKALKMLGLA